MSKVLERIVAGQVRNYLTEKGLYPSIQSGYREFYSTETALLRVQNDILRAIDDKNEELLVLLDLSAVFDTLDHDILISRLKAQFGLQGRCSAGSGPTSMVVCRGLSLNLLGPSRSHSHQASYKAQFWARCFLSFTSDPSKTSLRSQCHPKCFARGGTFFIYEKSAIFLIVVKSDLYLLPSLPLAIRKHWCEFRVDI